MKTELLFTPAAALGAAAIAWIGFDFIGDNPLALVITATIAVAYLLGLVELLQFRRASRSLGVALAGLDSASCTLPCSSRWHGASSRPAAACRPRCSRPTWSGC